MSQNHKKRMAPGIFLLVLLAMDGLAANSGKPLESSLAEIRQLGYDYLGLIDAGSLPRLSVAKMMTPTRKTPIIFGRRRLLYGEEESSRDQKMSGTGRERRARLESSAL